MSSEITLWNGSPSQLTNLPVYILWGLFFWLVAPIFVILWQYLVLKNTRFELTSQRLRLRRGVLNKKMDEVELYRIRDYKLDQPFLLRLFGLSNIQMTTVDKTIPVIVLGAVRDGERVRELIRGAVEECRTAKGVREIDF